MSKLNEVLLKQKRISQERYDAVKAKEQKRAEAKKQKDLSKLSKAELIALIESIL